MVSRRQVLGGIGAAAGIAAVGGIAPQARAANTETTFGYFRNWRDKADSKDGHRNTASIADVPTEVSLVIAFGGLADPGFAAALKNEYVPLLNGRGQKILSSVFIDHLLEQDVPNTDAGYAEAAAKIVDEKVRAHNLNGIDIDIEQDLAGEDLERAVGIFRALRTELGDDNILIYDTNKTRAPMFDAAGDVADYLLMQRYGNAADGIQRVWDTYAGHVAAEKFYCGFSFYEENGRSVGNYWDDCARPFESSNAYSQATWEPATGHKGGIFCYALDRDGVEDDNDNLVPTDYSWMKNLHKVVNGTYVPGSFTG